MTRQVYPAWRDDVAKSVFPFDDHSSLTSLDGETLPLALILDAAIHPPGLSDTVFLSALRIARTGLTFSIASQTGLEVCSGGWPSAEAIDNTVVPLTTASGAAAGLLVINPTIATQLVNSRERELIFPLANTQFVISVIRFVSDQEVNRGLTSGVVIPESGDVYLVGRNGVQLSCDDGVEISRGKSQSVRNVRVNAVGDPLGRRANCSPTDFETPRFVQQVVFQKDGKTHICSPTGLGEIFVLASGFLGNDTALRSYVDGKNIVFGLAGRTSETIQ